MKSRLRRWLLAVIVPVLLVPLLAAAAPALAAVSGAPQLEATLIGSNEFPVGQTAALQVMLLNKGTFSGEVKDPNDKAMARGYTNTTGAMVVPPCTTAVGIMATLKSATGSVMVLSGPAGIGTLSTGTAIPQPMSFQIRIPDNAAPGIYVLKLELSYQYLQDVVWLNSPVQNTPYYDPQFEFHWAQQTVTQDVAVRVFGTDFAVKDVKTDSVRVGATGTITTTIQNSGAGQATEVTAEIAAGDVFAPLDKGVFLGDLKGGDSKVATFKASVSKDAIVKVSPLNVTIKYKDSNNVVRQALVAVGVPVTEEPQFQVGAVKVDGKLTPGATAIVEIPVTNASGYVLNNAIARINIVDPFATAPFSTADEAAYIGTLKPGDTGSGKFRLTVDSDAVPKAYTLEVQVKYWDTMNNSYISDPVNAQVTVVPVTGFSLTTIVLFSLGGLVILFIIVNVVRRSLKK